VIFYGILTSCIFCLRKETKEMNASPAAARPRQEELCVAAFRITEGLVIDTGNIRRDFKECYEQVAASLRQQGYGESATGT
jgi:hypothetical protein